MKTEFSANLSRSLSPGSNILELGKPHFFLRTEFTAEGESAILPNVLPVGVGCGHWSEYAQPGQTKARADAFANLQKKRKQTPAPIRFQTPNQENPSNCANRVLVADRLIIGKDFNFSFQSHFFPFRLNSLCSRIDCIFVKTLDLIIAAVFVSQCFSLFSFRKHFIEANSICVDLICKFHFTTKTVLK